MTESPRPVIDTEIYGMPLAERARSAGAAVEGPTDTLWNSADVTVVDPDGYRITYTAPRPAERREAGFDAMMETLR